MRTRLIWRDAHRLNALAQRGPKLVRHVSDSPSRNPMVSTLSPRKLRSTDFLESLPTVFHESYQKPAPKHSQISVITRHRGSTMSWAEAPPPDNCRGFLYVHRPVVSSPFASSVRFRLTPNFDPTSSAMSPQDAFTAGVDLSLPGAEGMPWSVPLWRFVTSWRTHPYGAQLHTAGVHMFHPKMKTTLRELTRTGVIFYALGQPLLVEFHMAALRVYLPYPDTVARMRLEPGYYDWGSKVYPQPYNGMGIITVELLKGTLVTRVIKVLSLSEPYLNTKIDRPVEGQIRTLQLHPVLQKEATKRTDRRYINGQKHLLNTLARFPHISDIPKLV
ncbi:hypothetical protein R3P38DRAFT_1356254 [Favolaschia claudopus]|uniref:Uncharacterized protein n=1 Tax=Favolaschia claudopus TaxID=2862362 RepID=A0AAW0DUF6_9AGAR